MSIPSVSSTSFADFGRSVEGARLAKAKFEKAAEKIVQGEVTSSRMVELIESERMFEANLAVIRTQDEMVGSLLDVRR